MIAFIATTALALTRESASPAPLPLAPLSSLGALRPAPAAGPLGPEGVPIPHAPSLAGPGAVTPAENVDGISCQGGEQVLFHIHAHLTLVVRGRPRSVPAGIGIGMPRKVLSTPRGPFVAAGSCFTWLHTHAADGIIHTESPVQRAYTLGDFFDVWGEPLTANRVGPFRGAVTALFDGRRFTGNPQLIPLRAHAQIELEVGRPLVAPEQVDFPNGL